ncbi:hypothetical protein AVEN_211152-1 [Araneus ventricosus]|uniref:Uncharacterized protein n=1 Tax=Araneus ventricosus TaxID=182803 RepID=A0A4Y2CVB9_ARAVE|nr:hypothetical protein AVEN_211152-1 [Araneus ventricosus]
MMPDLQWDSQSGRTSIHVVMKRATPYSMQTRWIFSDSQRRWTFDPRCRSVHQAHKQYTASARRTFDPCSDFSASGPQTRWIFSGSAAGRLIHVRLAYQALAQTHGSSVDSSGWMFATGI